LIIELLNFILMSL